MKKSFLFKKSKEIILGSLLGDGSLKINKHYRNARFSFRHSIHQRDYFFWKVSQLKEISGEKCFWKSKNKDGFSGQKLRYQSLATKELTELYNFVCKKNKFKVQRKWLNSLTPMSLAVWWMDDGSIITNGRRGVFCTDGFSYNEQKIIARYLKVAWDINVHVGKVKKTWKGKEKTYYRLWIRSTEELKKFLRIILPCLEVESMLPKFLILYKNPNLQQRWISEVDQLSIFSEKVIKKYLLEKKKKWKNFRK